MCQAPAACGLMGFAPNGSGPCPISTISATLQQLSTGPCTRELLPAVCVWAVMSPLGQLDMFFLKKPNFSAENPAVAGGFT